ncbi:MAG: hypothetical protein FD134_376 [Gallionellaceae bacterium]|nr:MAG: hypothetical protein FD134_376 [Gallionellaceae bacterium]
MRTCVDTLLIRHINSISSVIPGLTRNPAITNIGYHTGTARQPSTKTGFVTVHPGTMVIDSTGGEVPIGHVTSAIDNSAERELILKTRAFLNAPDVLSFRHETSIHGM